MRALIPGHQTKRYFSQKEYFSARLTFLNQVTGRRLNGLHVFSPAHEPWCHTGYPRHCQSFFSLKQPMTLVAIPSSHPASTNLTHQPTSAVCIYIYIYINPRDARVRSAVRMSCFTVPSEARAHLCPSAISSFAPPLIVIVHKSRTFFPSKVFLSCFIELEGVEPQRFQLADHNGVRQAMSRNA